MLLAVWNIFCFLAPCVAQTEGCPHLNQNMDLLKQTEQYVPVPSGPSFNPSRIGTFAETHYYSDNRPDNLVRDVNYLTAPIVGMDGIKAAEKEALQMEERGQKQLAAQVRLRIKDAYGKLMGVPVNENKFICVSMAEQLKLRGWSCENAEAYDRAEQLYQRVLEIYQEEIGSSSRVASAMADLARVYAESKQTEKAKAQFSNTLQYYEVHKIVDSDLATFLESYAQFMDQQRSPTEASRLYKMAGNTRKDPRFKSSNW